MLFVFLDDIWEIECLCGVWLESSWGFVVS